MVSIVVSKRLCCSIFVTFLIGVLVTGCYTHDSIDTGEGYGFSIGDSKKEAFNKARKNFEGQVYILSPINDQGFGPHKQLSFSVDDYRMMVVRNQWEFYFDTGYRDLLRLSFSEEGDLIQIYRHKQAFELP